MMRRVVGVFAICTRHVRILASIEMQRLHYAPNVRIWRPESAAQSLPKGHRKAFGSGIEELDADLVIDNRLRLPNQLIHSLFIKGSVALAVNINGRSGTRKLSVDEHPKVNWRSVCGSHHQIQIARMELVEDRGVPLGGDNRLMTNDPVARQSPMIGSQCGGGATYK